jgi:hypothetical protein
LIKRVLGLAVAVAAVAAAAGVCVVAASYAVFAIVRTWLGPAGAAAVVAALFALVAVIAAAVALRKAAPPSGKGKGDEPLADRLMHMARQRPVTALAAAGVAAAAVLTVSIRNPGAITAIISALVAGSAARPRR